MNGSELSRIVKLRPQPPERITVTADEAERAALAERFAVPEIRALAAEVNLVAEGSTLVAKGWLAADLVQACAVSGDHFAVRIDEAIDLLFVAEGSLPSGEEEDVELDSSGPDEIEYQGETIDLGEAVAQTLGLAIDPYAVGPDADRARRESGITDDGAPRGPLAETLARLSKD
ncbi:YceD family protein [Tsuneonella sp. SYSU-LHT278]|uniref:YceD family protein n=1 Tax=Tsuneonella sediminis TaxID=3416089 RepID=UPI003F78B5B7